MAKERALVLGGGGPVGIAWEAGLAAGLKEGGVDIARADFILGTSAGSFVGAQLAGGRDAGSLAQAQIAMGRAQTAAARDPSRPRPPPPDLTPLMTLMAGAPQDGAEPSVELLKKFGVLALNAQTISEDEFLKTFGSIADGGRAWPERFACTAIDAESGAFKIWTAKDEIPLAHGIASSCCVPGIYPPVGIAGRRWIDGGMRSATNADLAAGYRRVLLVAVVAGAAADGRQALSARIERERDAILQAGGACEIITPDEASRAVFGVNLMNAARRAEVTEAGIAQGRRDAERLHAFWN